MKKIHITEAQLKALKKKITEDNQIDVAYKPTNGITTIQDITNQARNAKKAAPNADINMHLTSDDLNITEDVEEARNRFRPFWDKSIPKYGDIDYDYSDDENYDEMLTALDDFAKDPRYQDIFYNALDNGRNEDVHELLDLINNTCDFNIHPNALRQALRNNNSEHHYDNVMEGKLYTKKQIKEARLENIKKNCKVIKKKDI